MWNEFIPADTDLVKDGPQVIREMKQDIREFLSVAHFPFGEPNQGKIREGAGLPSASLNGSIFTYNTGTSLWSGSGHLSLTEALPSTAVMEEKNSANNTKAVMTFSCGDMKLEATSSIIFNAPIISCISPTGLEQQVGHCSAYSVAKIGVFKCSPLENADNYLEAYNFQGYGTYWFVWPRVDSRKNITGNDLFILQRKGIYSASVSMYTWPPDNEMCWCICHTTVSPWTPYVLNFGYNVHLLNSSFIFYGHVGDGVGLFYRSVHGSYAQGVAGHLSIAYLGAS